MVREIQTSRLKAPRRHQGMPQQDTRATGHRGRTMLGFGSDAENILSALAKSQAVIEFDLEGTIITANDVFCRLMGYRPEELKGRKHALFCDPSYVSSAQYKAFWQKLSGGQSETATFKRINKAGQEVWINGSYNPVCNSRGKPYKVVKIAADITTAQLQTLEDRGKMAAISRAQAVIEFTKTGEILSANENFLRVLGYSLAEIQGKHHSMFCEPSYTASRDYKLFWEKLSNGEFIAEEFKRIGKGGKVAWIQASYNPIFDAEGKVIKVVKFATDVTDRVRCVQEIGHALQALSDGDLTVSLERPFVSGLDQIRLDLNNAMEKLTTAMRTVAMNANAIAAGTNQIKSASDDLSRRTEQQAASVEETAAALEEVTQTVTDSAKRAAEAANLVARTKAQAEASSQVVRNAIDAMGQIENSSNEISNIIGVIDDIAFQTNLLALNAGVEAARAGEAGKGFAVVAQEVRELAQRSAKAAKEIKLLITTSSNQVETGVSLVGETGKALTTILAEVQEVNRNIGAIVEATREQATGLREINKAVNTMDQNTQQNAAMVEESSAASHGLAQQTENLRNLLEQFRFEKHSSARMSHDKYAA
ncbi:chemotaxis protein [Allorhizobium ampelinum]|nr:PAS domain S-box protein [Allorhizobium ampelinum]NSZ44083.1 PAS domain-containing protein [Agrobacterium vitis]NTA27831.1 PAS domain-containing protein [Allorhizobium ampelinum]OVE93568.1 chemotaxis protein [Allorhizobium ampelinum]